MDDYLAQLRRQREEMTQAMRNPLADWNRQREEMTQATRNPLADWNRQREAVQKITSSLKNTLELQTFNFSESLLAMDNVVVDTFFDIETIDKSNPSGIEQELITWLYEQINFVYNTISYLRNMCKTIETKSAIGHTITMINLVSAIITISGFLLKDNTEIHIHNHHEDVIIESETDGNKSDIYIEKKGAPNKLQIENQDDWYSGGERT